MDRIKELVAEIEKDLQSIFYKKEPEFLYEPIEYTLEQGGKRMRPLLVAIVYLMYKEDLKKVLPLCRAIEVFHNFTLLHDDIMDKAPLRRGKPTVFKKWNENIAILSGDVMLVQAYQYLLELDTDKSTKLIEVFNNGAIKVCEGQQFDMNFEDKKSVSVENYLEMIYLKTAALLDHSIEMAAIFAETSESDIALLKSFAKNVGIAFQLKDDLLDAYGDAEKFGKQVGGDIIANKKTFLLLKAMELSTNEQKIALKNLLYNESDKERKVKGVINIFNQLEIKKLTDELISQYFEKGMSDLKSISSSKSEKEILASYITLLMHRES